MTEQQISDVAAAIDAVRLFSRYNDWTSDAVPGFPIEICRAGAGHEDEVVVVMRYAADVSESDALSECISRARAVAALRAMGI